MSYGEESRINEEIKRNAGEIAARFLEEFTEGVSREAYDGSQVPEFTDAEHPLAKVLGRKTKRGTGGFIGAVLRAYHNGNLAPNSVSSYALPIDSTHERRGGLAP